MRQYAIVNFSRDKLKPIHRIDPLTKRTFCQIENNAGIKVRAGSSRALSKFDRLPPNQPMCKNCESLHSSQRTKVAPNE